MEQVVSQDHEAMVKMTLRELMTNESYWNVILFCKDGMVAHNRLILGLLFPQITDEISVICPDHSLQDINDLISGVLPPVHDDTNEEIAEESVEDTGVRDKFVLSHVMDTDLEVFQQHSEDHLITESFRSSDDENSNLGVGQDPLLPDDPVNEECPEEASPSNSATGLEAFILSCDQHRDSKSNISIHIDALSFKSPVKSARVSSKVRKIKLKKKQQVKEIDCKQAVQDEIEVKNLLNDLLDRVEKEESQPKNLVFSTLGTSHELTGQDQVEDDDDNISAYLESSPDHSREPSPEKTPEPFKDFDNSNSDGHCHNFNDFCDEINSVGDDNFEDIPAVPESEKTFKLGRCKVDIERRKLNEDEMRIAREYIDFRHIALGLRPKEKSQRGIASSSLKRKISRRDTKSTCNKLKEKLRLKRILAKKKLRKSKRCFECDSCKKPDCRKCLMCKDMKKYGGKGLKKQSCMTRPPCLFLENNKGTLKSIHAKKIKEIRNNGSLTKESLSQIKPAKMMKKASRVEELKSSRKPLSRSSSLEILEVQSPSSVKEKGPKAGASKERKGLSELKKRKETGSPSGPTLSTRREKLQKFAMVNSDDVMIRKNKIEEIRKKFKQQEEKALATNGKISSMMDLSREELLFGFYL